MKLALAIAAAIVGAWLLFLGVIALVALHPNGLPVLAAIAAVWIVFAARSQARYRHTTRRGVR